MTTRVREGLDFASFGSGVECMLHGLVLRILVQLVFRLNSLEHPTSDGSKFRVQLLDHGLTHRSLMSLKNAKRRAQGALCRV